MALDGNPPKKLRILLIEDHADTLETVALLLRRAHHEVHTAKTCTEARAISAALDDVDVVVGDIGLPDGDGVDLLAELKARHACPVIALTAYGMEEDVRRCTTAGVDLHLLKPIGVVELSAALRKMFGTA
jgi:DNA-binding response OmpR family regulator